MTFDQVRVQHLGLLKLQDGILGITGPEVDVCQAHQEVHVIPQQRFLFKRAEEKNNEGWRTKQWLVLAQRCCSAHQMVLMALWLSPAWMKAYAFTQTESQSRLGILWMTSIVMEATSAPLTESERRPDRTEADGSSKAEDGCRVNRCVGPYRYEAGVCYVVFAGVCLPMIASRARGHCRRTSL